MEYMSLDKYFKLLLKRWKIILYFSLAFLGLAILYGIFVYSPTYVSSSKILLKQDSPTTYVTELQSESGAYSVLGQNKNPVLTQMEVLKSYDMVMTVAEKLSQDTDFADTPKVLLANSLLRKIKLENPPGTDIIEVLISWNNPVAAQKIAKAYLDSYYSYNETVYKKSISNTKKYIENQLKDTNNKLDEIRDDIEKYRKKNSSINIDLEAGNVIQQTGRIEDLIADTSANIAQADKKYSELSQNLGVSLKNAVDSVAVGQSELLIRLNQNLNENQQKLANLKARYTENNPQLKVVASEVKETETQIKNEIINLVGKKNYENNKMKIADNVRAEMVSEYVKSSLDMKSLNAQRNTLQGILNNLKSNQKIIPEIQKTLGIMQEKEKNLALIAETLNTKLVEAKIKESAIVSNVNIVENPIMPVAESFPTLWHIIVLFVFAGALMGVATILGIYYIDDFCNGALELEEIIKAPVLGIIPWLTNNTYNNFLTDYNPHSVVAIIYQKIATSLKVKCYKKKINSIGIISAELEKRRSIVAASLANTFAKSDDKVILLDTDFRDGSLTREFNSDFSQHPDITDLVLELTKASDVNSYPEIISKYIIQIPGQNNLYLIPNNNKVDNPYEILNNEVFPNLIKYLKSCFDLVVVDTPPMLAVADSIIVSQYVDGLLVLCGIKTSRSNLRKIRKICDENYVEILGAVARDTLTELEVPENMYIKQLSGNIE